MEHRSSKVTSLNYFVDPGSNVQGVGYMWACTEPVDLITSRSVRVKIDPSMLSSFTKIKNSNYGITWKWRTRTVWEPAFLPILSRILWTSPGQLCSMAANHLAARLSDVIMLCPDAGSGLGLYDYVEWLTVWGKLLSGLCSVCASWSLLIFFMTDTNEHNSTKWCDFLEITFTGWKSFHLNIFG